MVSDKLLTKEDLLSLSKNPSVEEKNKTIKKVSAYYNCGELTEKGRQLAEDIFRLIVEDVETKVREVLSDSLKHSSRIPQDVIKKIVNDQNSVAVPFIKFYSSLSKEDLVSIIDARNIEKQKAVALRRNIDEDISDYIVEKCNEVVVGTLISNETAAIKEKTFHTIASKYQKSDHIKKRLVYRSELPVSVVEKIIYSLSEELQKTLVLSHNLPGNIASELVEQVKEKATLRVSEDYSSDKQIEELVHQLYSANRLTSSLAVRAICMGDLKFFEYAMVYLSNSPISEVRKILFNTKIDFMIRNLLRKAFIPKSMFPAVFSALKIIKDIRFDCRKSDRKSFVHRVIERILSVENASDELGEDDISYLISKIS